MHRSVGPGEHALLWQWPDAVTCVSSAPVGGGIRSIRWILNVGVSSDYQRTDLAEHSAEVASVVGLSAGGISLFTAADLTRRQRSTVGSATVDATVGISHPTWAADAAATAMPWRAGTINLVVQVDAVLEAGAAVNAIVTATEAKTQALFDEGVPGTGTASDAIAVVCPASSERPVEAFGGPRSRVGSGLARAVYLAVRQGVVASRGEPRVNIGRTS